MSNQARRSGAFGAFNRPYLNSNRPYKPYVARYGNEDDEIHVPIANNWHNDAIINLRSMTTETKTFTVEDFRVMMMRGNGGAGGRWTITTRQAAKFLLWAEKKRHLVEGRWDCFFSNTAETSKLNEEAIYTYKPKKFNIKEFIKNILRK